MFLRNDIVEFINKIINSENLEATINNNIEHNITEFSNYLRLTKMADEETLNCVDKILDCLPEIFALKQKVGYFDINTILTKETGKVEKEDQTKVKKIKFKGNHYDHYHDDDTSSSCGGGSTTRSGC